MLRGLLLAAALATGCGGAPALVVQPPAHPERSPGAAGTESKEPTHEALMALLRASTYDLSSAPDSECRYLVSKETGSILGPIVETMLPDADTQHSTCKPVTEGAFLCSTLIAHEHATGDEDSEWSTELDYRFKGGAIDWSTLRCMLAG